MNQFKTIAFVAGQTPEAREACARLEKRYGDADPTKADVIVALGGDGLMLQTLHKFMKVCQLAEKSGLKHGVVQDKIFLPGLMKLKFLRDSGFFGRILSVRGEFGYWVFEGELQPIQRPSCIPTFKN